MSTFQRSDFERQLQAEAEAIFVVEHSGESRGGHWQVRERSGGIGSGTVVAAFHPLGAIADNDFCRGQAVALAWDLRARFVRLGLTGVAGSETGRAGAAMPDHHPVPGSIVNKNWAPCPGADAEDYPLTGTCVCGARVTCADGTADWHHERPTSIKGVDYGVTT